MYTQRVITKANGLETWDDKFLGNRYTVYYRALKEEESQSGFEEIMERYFAQDSKLNDGADTLKGFIMAEYGSLSPFFEEDEVYILNSEGKTFRKVQ